MLLNSWQCYKSSPHCNSCRLPRLRILRQGHVTTTSLAAPLQPLHNLSANGDNGRTLTQPSHRVHHKTQALARRKLSQTHSKSSICHAATACRGHVFAVNSCMSASAQTGRTCEQPSIADTDEQMKGVCQHAAHRCHATELSCCKLLVHREFVLASHVSHSILVAAGKHIHEGRVKVKHSQKQPTIMIQVASGGVEKHQLGGLRPVTSRQGAAQQHASKELLMRARHGCGVPAGCPWA